MFSQDKKNVFVYLIRNQFKDDITVSLLWICTVSCISIHNYCKETFSWIKLYSPFIDLLQDCAIENINI